MTDVDYPDLVVQLKERMKALGDGGDCRSDNEKARWRATRTSMQSCLSVLQSVETDLVKPARLLADAHARRALTLDKQKTIEQQLAALPPPQDVAHPHARAAAFDEQRHLALQLQLLHDGLLYAEPGVCYERLADVDATIAALQQRIARVQATHRAVAEQAVALLAVPVPAVAG